MQSKNMGFPWSYNDLANFVVLILSFLVFDYLTFKLVQEGTSSFIQIQKLVRTQNFDLISKLLTCNSILIAISRA